jgi:predicted transcriptional regulator
MAFVKDVLLRKQQQFNHVLPGTPVIEALHIMKALNVSYVVVMEGHHYKGVFCETDYARNLILRGLHSNSTEVKDVMTVDLPVVRLNHTIDDCKNLFASYSTRYLLAFDDIDQFIAVITPEDIMEFLWTDPGKPFPGRQQMHLLDEYF